MIVISASLAKTTSLMVLAGKQYAPVSLQATVTETNLALTAVSATLDWNDGTPPVVYAPALPLAINATRNLRIGTYFITLSAANFLNPTPQKAFAYFTVEIQPEAMVPIPTLFLFGPILPRDIGFPNAQQWNFDTGNDLLVLASSVKMLLITAKSERIMLPPYGTNLRRIVFEPNTNAISSTIRQEIDDALTQFEPRVKLDSFTVTKLGPRDVQVDAQFLSKINQSSFSLALPFSQ